MKRAAITALALMLVAAAVPAAANEVHSERTFRVTVYNLTDGQPMTQPVAAIHHTRATVFRKGTRASGPVEQLAENGNAMGVYEALQGAPGVRAVASAGEGAISPGGSSQFYISSDRGNRLSLVSMVVCTNDGITGVDSLRVPSRVGDYKAVYAFAYDAGSERNTEALADLVPPCSGFESGTGMSNADLAQNRVITRHPGLTNTGGEGLIDAEAFGWDPDAPVMKIVVERVS